MSRLVKLPLIPMLLMVSGCVSLPSGPSVMVLPGTGQTFEKFRNDDAMCQQFAYYRIGGETPNQAGFNSGVASAAVGTVVGAAAGAAIGGGGGGAAIGAGTGLAAGSIVGSGTASSSMYEAQQYYDVSYIQCMYTKGHQVPVSGQFSGAISSPPTTVPSTANIPPPPPGSPPPPPPSLK